MKAVGEVMAIGRTFEESLGKALRSLENGRSGLGRDGHDEFDETHFKSLVSTPTEHRIYYMAEALRRGMSAEELASLSLVDPWFIDRLAGMVEVEGMFDGRELSDIDARLMRLGKRYGLSDVQIAQLTGSTEGQVRARRKELGVIGVFKTVDTCAGEFASQTSYYYKTYEDENEVRPCDRPKAMIIGAGPNRIGQGIEFDYCCVQASYALSAMGYETIMVNCNPETVSTDYDTSDRLYFEPITYEDVMDIIDAEAPDGVVVTLGGQTPLKLAQALADEGVHIMGTQPAAIDLAEDRDRFSALLDELGIPYPVAGVAESLDDALAVAERIGYPLLVRPSYVLGGRGMVIAYDEQYLERYMARAARVTPDHPVYLDAFLESATECDVDALCDGEEVYIGAILEHIEEAGIHSGDSACCTPPFSFSDAVLETLVDYTTKLALAVQTKGLVNIQFAVKDGKVYVIEVNPRASRTVPFVSKATGVSLAQYAARIMAGEKIASFNLPARHEDMGYYACKEAVMPFGRFPGAETMLGPEMKSTGEVMGIARDFPSAYAKTQLAIDYSLPKNGKVFISVCDREKRNIVPIAHALQDLGFSIVSTGGTGRLLRANGLDVEITRKMQEARPNIGDMIANGEISLLVNIPFGQETRGDSYHLRSAAVRHGICYVTTLAGANALAQAISAVRDGRLSPVALQDL